MTLTNNEKNMFKKQLEIIFSRLCVSSSSPNVYGDLDGIIEFLDEFVAWKIKNEKHMEEYYDDNQGTGA